MPEPAVRVHLFKDDDVLERWYNNSFVKWLRQATEISKYRNCKCFDCQKEGHCWHQCQEPLLPELQELADKQDKEHKKREQKVLNPKGGTGMKGGHTPMQAAGGLYQLPTWQLGHWLSRLALHQ